MLPHGGQRRVLRRLVLVRPLSPNPSPARGEGRIALTPSPDSNPNSNPFRLAEEGYRARKVGPIFLFPSPLVGEGLGERGSTDF